MNNLSVQHSDFRLERVKLSGVVYTPQEVADEAVGYIASELKNRAIKVLEPSCGDGSFLTALINELPDAEISAIDIDADALAVCELKNFGPNYFLGDFFETIRRKNFDKFDLIIGNPPYIRTSNFNEALKLEVELLAERLAYPKQELRNSWAAFVLACEELLSDDGKMVFVLPYELITVGYAETLRQRLLEKFEQVEIFIPDEKAFREIDQDAVLLIASKVGTSKKGLSLNRVKSLDDLSTKKSSNNFVKIEHTNSAEMKSFLLSSEQLELIHKIRKSTKKVGDVCTSAAGTVTAANDFFILNDQDVDDLGLRKFVRPIVQKASHIPFTPEFCEADFEELRSSGKPCYLVDLGKIEQNELTDQILDYIKSGVDRNLHLRYKCRHRDPWFKVPIVPSSDGFFFKRSHLIPKIYCNNASVLTTDSAYQIRMKPEYSMRGLSYSFYNSMTLLFSEIDGRFYGGGVLELTPREFRGLPLVFRSVSDIKYTKFIEAFDPSKKGFSKIVLQGDKALKKALSLQDEDMCILKSAHEAIRNHRLRHGKP